MPTNLKICLQALYDISNVKLIPKEFVKSGMDYIFGKSDDESDVDDLILISIVSFVALVVLGGIYFIVRKSFPKVREKIEAVVRMIFFNIIITAYLKAYLRLSLSACEKSMNVLAGDTFEDERPHFRKETKELTTKDTAISALLFIFVAISSLGVLIFLRVQESDLI